ncbi:MAG: helix-turn-helix transcriptional regulator [Cyclobacteriaceae bacterium]|nr:helix-turn-helix transcriptional regulator [Cyclobacteriaceae bacterium SS2]
MDTQVNIKGMVCNRCIYTIKKHLQEAGMFVIEIALGRVILGKPLAEDDKTKIKNILSSLGFDLISDKNEQQLSDIKSFIHQWIDAGSGRNSKENLSDSLASHFLINYDSLSMFFSRLEGKSIERYHIEKRLESVKELLVYTDWSLSEVAYNRGFSSVHHLSAQFKKVTGLNPSHFREIQAEKARVSDRHKDKMV